MEAHLELHADGEAHADILLVRNNYGGALQREKQYMKVLEVQQNAFDKMMSRPPSEETMWPRKGMFMGDNLAESYRLWTEGDGASDPDIGRCWRKGRNSLARFGRVDELG